MRRTTPLLLLAILLAACDPASSTAFTSTDLGRGADGWRGIPIDARPLPDVTLYDAEGEPVRLDEDFADKPMLLFFGYTSCPDICPAHLAVLASAMRSSGVSPDQVPVVFVSVDPERDTPGAIEDYLANFDRRFIGLHADLDVIADALDQLDLPGPVVEGPDPRGEGDLIGHPAQIIGFDADGTAQRVWPFGARRADWVDDLPLIAEQWSSPVEARS
ncbi:SCO family protein [Nitriliruptoraceae bacterium ZYF776]|nr:SCO family protein [Profundirhabdus halotolerans]